MGFDEVRGGGGMERKGLFVRFEFVDLVMYRLDRMLLLIGDFEIDRSRLDMLQEKNVRYVTR